MDPNTAGFGDCIEHTGAKDQVLTAAHKPEARGEGGHGICEREKGFWEVGRWGH